MVQDVGRNIRRICRERDLSQTQVARLVGIRQQHLSFIECGLEPPLALVARIAKVMGVHAGRFRTSWRLLVESEKKAA